MSDAVTVCAVAWASSLTTPVCAVNLSASALTSVSVSSASPIVIADVLVGSVTVDVATGLAPAIVDTAPAVISVNFTFCSSVGVPILETVSSV